SSPPRRSSDLEPRQPHGERRPTRFDSGDERGLRTAQGPLRLRAARRDRHQGQGPDRGVAAAGLILTWHYPSNFLLARIRIVGAARTETGRLARCKAAKSLDELHHLTDSLPIFEAKRQARS